MKEIIETTHLEYNKSGFLIDLVRHQKGSLYIEITQKIQARKNEIRKILLNPSVVSDLIQVLKMYHEKIPLNNNADHLYLSDETQKEIQNCYLKGILIEDLALQFEHSEELIKSILRNKGIKIVSNKLPKYKRYWRNRKK